MKLIWDMVSLGFLAGQPATYQPTAGPNGKASIVIHSEVVVKSLKLTRVTPTRLGSLVFLTKWLPSGNLLHSYWKWPFIVDLPIKNGDFP